MKAHELMAGDWIYAINDSGKHICRANNIEIDYVNGTEDFCVDFFGTGYDVDSEFPDVTFNVEPIPITPEILKKNGFKWLCDEKGGRKTYVCNEPLILVTWMKDHYMLSIGPAGSPKMPFVEVGWAKYVHELQHALRLCGIDKEIEL